MYAFIKNIVPSAVSGAITGFALSLATPLPEEADFFTKDIEDDHVQTATIIKHVISGVAGAVVGVLVNWSTQGKAKEGDSKYESILSKTAAAVNAIALTATGVLIAGEAYPEITPTNNSIANTTLAVASSAVVMATTAFWGLKPAINIWQNPTKKIKLSDAMHSAVFANDESDFSPFLPRANKKPDINKWKSASITLGQILILLNGAAAGLATSLANPLPEDLKFFTLDIDDSYADIANISKHAGSAIVGALLSSVISKASIGSYSEEYEKYPRDELAVGLIGSLPLMFCGIVQSGLAFSEVNVSDEPKVNKALASLLAGATITAFTYVGTKPLINVYQTKPAKFKPPVASNNLDDNEDNVSINMAFKAPHSTPVYINSSSIEMKVNKPIAPALDNA